jgi:hypothetical protein
MSEPFDAIGFQVKDEESYQLLAQEAHQRGDAIQVQRERGLLTGYCWRVGAGIEVWAMFYEAKEGPYFADCRPAFRARHLFQLYPWEIAEYEEDGEAIARGTLPDGARQTIFELQNITEINPADFRERPVTAAISGLAYRAQVNARPGAPTFTPLGQLYSRRKTLENDYAVRGRIRSWRDIQNAHTARDLIVIDVDADAIKLEVVTNRETLRGELTRGGWLSAEVWLQGHILSDQELRLRYEGVDREMPLEFIWQRLRREN